MPYFTYLPWHSPRMTEHHTYVTKQPLHEYPLVFQLCWTLQKSTRSVVDVSFDSTVKNEALSIFVSICALVYCNAVRSRSLNKKYLILFLKEPFQLMLSYLKLFFHKWEINYTFVVVTNPYDLKHMQSQNVSKWSLYFDFQ